MTSSGLRVGFVGYCGLGSEFGVFYPSFYIVVSSSESKMGFEEPVGILIVVLERWMQDLYLKWSKP
jgi:hypothetical protein